MGTGATASPFVPIHKPTLQCSLGSILIGAVLCLSGCSLPIRQHAVPHAWSEKAEVVGLPGARYVVRAEMLEFVSRRDPELQTGARLPHGKRPRAEPAPGQFPGPRFRDSGLSTTLDADTGFGIGDLFVQPVWLGWGGKHYDVSAGYGFYAPTGEEGIGLEFWTHQFQLAGAWYPFEHRGTAVTLAGTYEIQSEMEDKDLTPGDRVSLNWGVSQCLPLDKEQAWLAELGASGYSQWQVEKDSGSDVPQILNVQLNAKDEIHAAGLQAGLTFVPWKTALTIRYQWEFGAEAQFEGENLVVTLEKGF
ncbi:MAG: SphA family protein [Gammaproteobacteria bacterium]